MLIDNKHIAETSDDKKTVKVIAFNLFIFVFAVYLLTASVLVQRELDFQPG